MPRDKDTNYIIEFIPMGNYVKVSAIDPDSGREVSIVGDPKRSDKELEQIAVQKLLYVLNKENKK